VRDAEGTVHKLHMATLCGIAHLDYNQPLVHSYEQAFQVMRVLGLPYPAAAELYRRMCFNVVAMNCDDHTKNISFLMDPQGDWHLAPAYDVTYAYHPESLWLRQHQMSVNGKRTRSDHRRGEGRCEAVEDLREEGGDAREAGGNDRKDAPGADLITGRHMLVHHVFNQAHGERGCTTQRGGQHGAAEERTSMWNRHTRRPEVMRCPDPARKMPTL
jgi:hypothetical protein